MSLYTSRRAMTQSRLTAGLKHRVLARSVTALLCMSALYAIGSPDQRTVGMRMAIELLGTEARQHFVVLPSPFARRVE